VAALCANLDLGKARWNGGVVRDLDRGEVVTKL
jgi:hypothetical protein